MSRHRSNWVVLFTALLLGASPLAAADKLFILHGGKELWQISSDNPTQALRSVGITGLLPFDALVAIDVRPATGDIYGVGHSDRLYRIDWITGAAEVISAAPFNPPLGGSRFGIDFSPGADRIRLVSDQGQNFRIHPDTGEVFGDDNSIYNVPPQSKTPVGLAYSNNRPGAQATTAYMIETYFNYLVMLGGANGSPSPSSGNVTTVGGLGFDPEDVGGFDIAPSGNAYASMKVGGLWKLYSIDLATGAAGLIGPIGDGFSIVMGLSAVGLPKASIEDVSIVEGSASSVTMTITLAEACDFTVAINYASKDATAVTGADYPTAAGYVEFMPGETSRQITIGVYDDAEDENDEEFMLELSNFSNALAGKSAASVRIIDNEDAIPSDVPPSSGDDGTQNPSETGEPLAADDAASDDGCGIGLCGIGAQALMAAPFMLPVMRRALSRRRREPRA